MSLIPVDAESAGVAVVVVMGGGGVVMVITFVSSSGCEGDLRLRVACNNEESAPEAPTEAVAAAARAVLIMLLLPLWSVVTFTSRNGGG